MDTVTQSKLNCVKCGYNLTGVAIGGGCPECGEPIESSLSATITPKTSGVAIASMVTGICSLPLMLGCGAFGLPLPIVAVVLGHVARGHISAQPGALQGRGMALTGLITGYVSIGLMVSVGLLMAAALMAGGF